MSKIIGITGGIASGKSNIIRIIKEKGYKIINSDQIYNDLVQKGGIIYQNILNNFGPDYLDDDGNIDRIKLGKLIYNDNNQRIKLNNITHPIIKDVIKKEIKKSNDSLIFVEIPLLFEAKFEDICDFIIVSYLPKDIQIKRLMYRDNIDKEYAIKKINSQMQLDEKKELADFIIDTSSTFKNTEKQVIELLDKLKEI